MKLDWDLLLYTVGKISLSSGSIVDDQWGIEGIYSQQFSVGIFFFLLICVVVFTVIVVKFMTSGSGSSHGASKEGGAPVKNLKKGEKLMFIWIFLGIAVAVIMAAMQLLQGYLF